jgi:hypothetical protein
MLTDFTITDADVGRVLPITDGFLVSLTMTASPSVYEVPDANPATQQFKSGYFTLRGTGDVRNLYNSLTGHLSKFLIANHSLSYRGDLKVVCVPRGSTWSITLSDIALSKQERNEQLDFIRKRNRFHPRSLHQNDNDLNEVRLNASHPKGFGF